MEHSRAVPISDGSLWVSTSSGDATIVFVHGFSVDQAMWDDQVRALADSFGTVRYDLRGFGRSTPPSPARHHADDLVELLDALDLGRVVLVGLSLGANVCLACAAAHPRRVVGTVLASPGLPGRVWSSPRPPSVALDVARAAGVEAARRFWLASSVFEPGRSLGSRSFQRLQVMVERFPAHQWRDGPQSAALPSLAEFLERIEAPALIVSGEFDDAGYLELASEIARRVPNAWQTTIAGAGHFANLDEPDQFNSILRAALDTWMDGQ